MFMFLQRASWKYVPLFAYPAFYDLASSQMLQCDLGFSAFVDLPLTIVAGIFLLSSNVLMYTCIVVMWRLYIVVHKDVHLSIDVYMFSLANPSASCSQDARLPEWKILAV